MNHYWDIVGFIRQCEDRGYNFSSTNLRNRLVSTIFRGKSKRQKTWILERIHEFYYDIDPFIDG